MIVEMDATDIKDKLNNLQLVMKAKAKSKYGKGKRKQKVAVRTKTGKVVMETRTVGEGEDKKKPKALSAKQHQMIKDAFKDNPVYKDGNKRFQQHVLLSLVDKLDHIHPNHGMTDDDIKHHVKNHPDFHAFHGRDSLFINMNVDKKGKKKVKEKPNSNGSAIDDLVRNSNYPLSAQTISVQLNQTQGIKIKPSDIEKHLKNHPEFKTIKEGNLLTFGNRTKEEPDYEFREIKERKGSPREKKIDSAINNLVGSNVRHFAEKITNGEVPIDTMIKMKEALEMTHPSLKIKVSDIKKHIKRNALDYKNQAEYDNKYVENLIHTAFTNTRVGNTLMVYKLLDHDTLPDKMLKKLESVLAKTHPEISISLGDIKAHLAKYDKTYRERLAEAGYKVKEKPPKQHDNSWVNGRVGEVGTPGIPGLATSLRRGNRSRKVKEDTPRKPQNPLLQAMDKEGMDKFFGRNKEGKPPKKKDKLNGSIEQDTKGWTDTLEAFEKQGKSIPRNQFHALKNKFGVKDHKMHAPEWVHDKETDSYVHKPKIWVTTKRYNVNGKTANVKVQKRKMKI